MPNHPISIQYVVVENRWGPTGSKYLKKSPNTDAIEYKGTPWDVRKGFGAIVPRAPRLEKETKTLLRWPPSQKIGPQFVIFRLALIAIKVKSNAQLPKLQKCYDAIKLFGYLWH